ncbi:MAG: DNA repair protein RecO [Phormidesmis sp.]
MTQRNYKATGINLKAMPMNESDRLVTVLTKEWGLIRAIAPGSRKHKSRLGGRSGLFVVNELLLIKGKSIDKIVQAETQQTFPKLSTDLARLTASQYLAEIALSQALSDQPQEELYYLLLEHLKRIEAASRPNILPCLTQATFHLLALAGVAPEVFRCALSRAPLEIELGNPDWKVGFSITSGGVVKPAEIEKIERDRLQEAQQQYAEYRQEQLASQPVQISHHRAAEAASSYSGSLDNESRPGAQISSPERRQTAGLKAKVSKEIARNLGIVDYLNGFELALMQQLSKPELIMMSASPAFPQTGTIGTSQQPLTESGPHQMWQRIERVLRAYTQYQLDRPIRSADLIDMCFTAPTPAL